MSGNAWYVRRLFYGEYDLLRKTNPRTQRSCMDPDILRHTKLRKALWRIDRFLQ